MSITASTAQSICLAPTNTSPSKALFSFSKAPRFGVERKLLQVNFTYQWQYSSENYDEYQILISYENLQKIKCSNIQSVVTKMSHMIFQLLFRREPHHQDMVQELALFQTVRPPLLSDIDDIPSPTAYGTKSDFDKADPHARAYSFGIAREAYSKVYLRENPPLDKNIPGPGTYVIPPKIGAEASKYSMKGRTINHVMLTSTRFNPGPGAYDPKVNFDPNGTYFVGKIHNSKAPTFSLPTLPRFKEDKKDFRPGPGSYQLKVGIADPTSSFVSTYKSPKIRSFYHSDRQTLDITKDQKSYPGPGNYKAPSDFGHYESKNKFMGLKGSMSQQTL